MKLFLLLVLIEVLHRRVCSGYHVKDVLPFLVKIEANGKILDCAGTILAKRVVLTSAHCVDGVRPPEATISHFTDTWEIHEVDLIIIYPGYQATTLGNDIALVQTVQPFKEPLTRVTLSDVHNPPKCSGFQIVGWSGQMSDSNSKKNSKSAGKLMIAPVKLMPNSECSNTIKEFRGILQGTEKLCGITNDDGECFTGPGGPLLCVKSHRRVLQTMSTPEQRVSPTGRPIKNETLADPIDLLANFDLSEGSIAERAASMNPTVAPFSSTVQGSAAFAPPTIYQVGVVSWGKSCSKVPSVYVRTDLYLPWIMENVELIAKKNGSRYPLYTFLTPLKGSGTLLRLKWLPLASTITIFFLLSEIRF